ncbi:MAG TPA: xanthine dehydrogenase family protein molybdopterin-binding subunit [Luteibacter sp.]|uniref:xanthine dehydrogenase family protein molybdopterin-binding subunit n=1 Tax=Luteibacter sp. TaxID=1886636 RepID=UPI002BF8E990|nr:xanthine dehydrogenase family protein molybdopterin-binding subunit [Luteibacter sp.]HVI54193.1 xanthine dehydrogenase family protein molybdopterin-binding subunit [Luteibacter sp.]
MTIRMDTTVGITPLDDRPDGFTGKPLDRVDGPLKVQGKVAYAAEHGGVGAVAYAFPVLASIARGRLLRVDTTAACRAPGVIEVLTAKNAPRQDSSAEGAMPQLTGDTVKHYGQPVALVVAQSYEQARYAASLVRPEYDAQEGRFDLAAGVDTARTPKDLPFAKTDTGKGDFEAAYAAAPHRLDVVYTTPFQFHAAMEPHATMASWDGDKLTVQTSNQMPTPGRKALAATFGLAPGNVRLLCAYIGGGFGSKLDVQPDAVLAALAAKATGRTVKLVLTRQQLFHVVGHRTNTIQRVRLGTDAEGRLLAEAHQAWSGNEPGNDEFEPTVLGTRSRYAGEHRLNTHRLVDLDLPPAISMRAPGEAVGLLALEGAMDELAVQLDIDPIELRIRNEPLVDPELGVPFSSRKVVECMREGARRFGWDKRVSRPASVRDGRWLVGIGMSSAVRGNMLQASKANVTLDATGQLTARMAMTDIGTGSYTVFTQIAADLLGLPMERVTVLLGDSDFPETPGSGGSFGAASAGSGLYDACMQLRSKLCQSAGIDPQRARFEDGHVTDGKKRVGYAALAGTEGVTADGGVEPGTNNTNYNQNSYGAFFAEVGVDVDTGEIRLRRMLGVFAAGRILNPKTARSQALGGMIFGVGSALSEEMVLDERYGAFVNHDLAEYHVPVNADIGSMEAIFLPELDDKANPLKIKGLGEVGISGAGACIANAVYNACGVRIRDYPLTLDKVLAGWAEGV